MTWQERAYLILSEPEYSLFGFYVSIFILFAILVSTTTFVMETLPEYQEQDSSIFQSSTSIIPRCCREYMSALGTSLRNQSHWEYLEAKAAASDSGSFECWCYSRPLPIFQLLELISMIIFTTEFLLRFLLSASLRFGADLKLYFNIASEFPNEPALRSAVGNMVEFLILPPNVIDLLAILPFYVDLMWPDLNSNINSRVLRVLRLARVFRVLKMGKYSQGAQMVCCFPF